MTDRFESKPIDLEKSCKIRDKASELLDLMNEVCPPSRELSVAVTNLETSIMWANKALAFNPT